MFLKIEKNRYDKLQSLLHMLDHIGKSIAESKNRKIYSYKGLIWVFRYISMYHGIKKLEYCILETKDWEDYPKSDRDDNRFSTEDIIKAVVQARIKLDAEIEKMDTFNVPDSSYPNALNKGIRYDNDNGIFMEIRRGYYHDIPTLDDVAYAAIRKAANLDWYYENEDEL